MDETKAHIQQVEERRRAIELERQRQFKILENGLVRRLFTREGWIWQNIDVPDYMHFDTVYPSRPFPGG